MRYFFEDFIKEEDGVEAMEWLAIVCVAAVMIAIAAKCADAIKSKMTSVASYI